MKIKIFTMIILFVSGFAYAQQQDKDFERKYTYELMGRASFYEINNRYQILKDTIFYSNTGFLINADWDERIMTYDI